MILKIKPNKIHKQWKHEVMDEYQCPYMPPLEESDYQLIDFDRLKRIEPDPKMAAKLLGVIYRVVKDEYNPYSIKQKQ